jgi:hypothetical protein
MKYGWRDVPNIRHNPTTDEDDESGRPMSDKEWRMKYISALLYCVSGNNIKRPEREWIAGYVGTFCSDPDLVDFVYNYEPNAEDLSNFQKYKFRSLILRQTQAHVLLYDAISAATADGALKPEELEHVRHVAKRLGILEDALQRIHDLVDEERMLRQRKVRILKTVLHDSLSAP